MGELKRVGELEIDEDLEYDRGTWRVQRAGWLLMLLLVIGALSGLFGGGGPLTPARVSTSKLRLDYERFARHASLTSLHLEIEPAAFTGHEARVWIDREFLAGHELQFISPEPAGVSTAGDTLWFTFAVRDASRPTRVKFDLLPNRMWLRRGRAGTPTGPALEFSQLVYP